MAENTLPTQSQEADNFQIESKLTELKSSLITFRDAARTNTDRISVFVRDLFSAVQYSNRSEQKVGETSKKREAQQQISIQEFNNLNSLLQTNIETQRKTVDALRRLNQFINTNQPGFSGNVNGGNSALGTAGAVGTAGALGAAGLSQNQSDIIPQQSATSSEYQPNVSLPAGPGNFGVESRSRDQLDELRRKPGQRDVSLDFNSFAGGKGVLIVIPDDATPMEISAAQEYVKGVTSMMASMGYENYKVASGGQYGPGIRTTSENGRGKTGIFHTEPFFAQDKRAVEIFNSEQGLDAYSQVLANTLGKLPGTRFIPPHEVNAPGSEMRHNGQTYTERSFAIEKLSPRLRDIALQNQSQLSAPSEEIESRVRQLQMEEASIRKGPLNDRTLKVLEYAAEQTGTYVNVVSGSQPNRSDILAQGAVSDGAESPTFYINGKAVAKGSTRHDIGIGAADFYLTDATGNKFDMSNPEHRKKIQEFLYYSGKAGFTGAGADVGYMGQYNIHGGFGRKETEHSQTWSGTGSDFQAAFTAGANQRISEEELNQWYSQRVQRGTPRTTSSSQQQRKIQPGEKGTSPSEGSPTFLYIASTNSVPKEGQVKRQLQTIMDKGYKIVYIPPSRKYSVGRKAYDIGMKEARELGVTIVPENEIEFTSDGYHLSTNSLRKIHKKYNTVAGMGSSNGMRAEAAAEKDGRNYINITPNMGGKGYNDLERSLNSNLNKLPTYSQPQNTDTNIAPGYDAPELPDIVGPRSQTPQPTQQQQQNIQYPPGYSPVLNYNQGASLAPQAPSVPASSVEPPSQTSSPSTSSTEENPTQTTLGSDDIKYSSSESDEKYGNLDIYWEALRQGKTPKTYVEPKTAYIA